MSKPGKKKGLSMEEKCERVKNWFGTHPHPYTLKELTSLLPKATGVIWQSIEECVELLVSEGHVRQDKVGVHTLFWRFPHTAAQAEVVASNAGHSAGASGGGRGGQVGARSNLADRLALLTLGQLQEQQSALEATLQELKSQLQNRQAEVGEEEAVRQDADTLRACQQLRAQLTSQLERLAAFHPQLLVSLQDATRLAYDSANRWTDNYFLLEQHMAVRVGPHVRDMRALLRVPEDLDFVEWKDLQRGARQEADGEEVQPPQRSVSPRSSAHTSEFGGRRTASLSRQQQRHEPSSAPDDGVKHTDREDPAALHASEAAECANTAAAAGIETTSSPRDTRERQRGGHGRKRLPTVPTTDNDDAPHEGGPAASVSASDRPVAAVVEGAAATPTTATATTAATTRARRGAAKAAAPPSRKRGRTPASTQRQ